MSRKHFRTCLERRALGHGHLPTSTLRKIPRTTEGEHGLASSEIAVPRPRHSAAFAIAPGTIQERLAALPGNLGFCDRARDLGGPCPIDKHLVTKKGLR
jgi:hypothetical protein